MFCNIWFGKVPCLIYLFLVPELQSRIRLDLGILVESGYGLTEGCDPVEETSGSKMHLKFSEIAFFYWPKFKYKKITIMMK